MEDQDQTIQPEEADVEAHGQTVEAQSVEAQSVEAQSAERRPDDDRSGDDFDLHAQSIE